MAAPTLGTEEYQYQDTGVLLNGSSSTLPFFDVESITGVDSSEARVQTHDQEGVDGGYVDAEFEQFRTIVVEGHAYCNPSAVETYLDSLKANYAPQKFDQPFYIGTDNGMRVAFGKSTGARYTKDSQRRLGIIPMQLTVICQDPRLYEVPELSANTNAGGTATVTIGGNRSTPATLTITGPVTSPVVTHNVSGTQFSFPGFSLPSGQTLSINLGTKAILQQQSTNRRPQMTLTGNWYLLLPGSNQFTFTGSGTTGATSLNVKARSAWR